MRVARGYRIRACGRVVRPGIEPGIARHDWPPSQMGARQEPVCAGWEPGASGHEPGMLADEPSRVSRSDQHLLGEASIAGTCWLGSESQSCWVMPGTLALAGMGASTKIGHDWLLPSVAG